MNGADPPSEDAGAIASPEATNLKVAGDTGHVELCLLGLPKFMDKKKFATFLKGLKGMPESLKQSKVYQKDMGFLTFANAEIASRAREVLSKVELKGRLIYVRERTTGSNKRGRSDDGAADNERGAKKAKQETRSPDDLELWLKTKLAAESEAAVAAAGESADAQSLAAAPFQFPRSISDVVTPLWEMDYAVQLQRKQTEMRKVLVKVWRKTRGVYFARSQDNSKFSRGRGRGRGRGGRGSKVTKAEFFKQLRLNFEESGLPAWLEHWHSHSQSSAGSSSSQTTPPGAVEAVAAEEAALPSSTAPAAADIGRRDEVRGDNANAGERDYISIEDSRLDPLLYCPVGVIVGAPLQDGYRNKCEMSIGSDTAGCVRVGFRMGSFEQGVHVAGPAPCLNVSTAMKQVAAKLQAFLESSPLKPYDLSTHQGVWRALVLRSSSGPAGSVGGAQMMAVVQLSPKGALQNANAAMLLEELERLVAEFGGNQLDSLFVQMFDGLSAPAPDHPVTLVAVNGVRHAPGVLAVQHEIEGLKTVDSLAIEDGTATTAVGSQATTSDSKAESVPARTVETDSQDGTKDGAIVEQMLGLQFRISPNAFFQVNTPAAELLYSAVRREALRPIGNAQAGQSKDNLTILDVCCGTGSIGLCVAAAGACRVIGIELCRAATVDAVANAKLNGTANCFFVCSPAEKVMGRLLAARAQPDAEPLLSVDGQHIPLVASHGSGGNLVAIVDPPRGGLHGSVLKALRSCQLIRRVVYVSCNPKGSFIDNAVTLCAPTSKAIKGKPFVPVRANPFDLFPHTPHTELLCIFER